MRQSSLFCLQHLSYSRGLDLAAASPRLAKFPIWRTTTAKVDKVGWALPALDNFVNMDAAVRHRGSHLAAETYRLGVCVVSSSSHS